MATNTTPYINALRPRVTIKTVDGVDTLYTYDAFLTNNDISIGTLDMENAMGETGTFSMQINDHNNEISKDHIHDVKVYLELGKTSSSFQHFLVGYGDIFQVDRPDTNAQFYNLNGFGSKIWAYQLYISRRERYRKDESDAKVCNIVDNALTKRLWRPLKDKDDSIRDITGYIRDGISAKVKTPYTVIDESFTYFGDLCDKLCDVTGAVWFIDHSTADEVFTLTYTPELETNIILKSMESADRNNDDPNRTAYIAQGFGIEDNMTSDSGTYSRLFTVSKQDSVKVFEIGPTVGKNSLTFRAIGQQIVIDNDARRIEQIELSLSKKGEPTSSKDRLNGDIVLDNGNKPTGHTLDEFNIDLGSIKHNPEKIKIDVDISAKDLDVAQAKIWVRLFQRSNGNDINGDPDGNADPNHSTEHEVYWHHNNIQNTAQAYYSATTSEGDFDKKDTYIWNSVNTGPLYRISIYSDIRRLFARTNSRAKNTIRLRENLINTDFLSDPSETMRYLSLVLSQSSKGRRAIGDIRSTVPNDFLFRPYQGINFTDTLSGIDDTLQIQRARYTLSGYGGDDTPLGTFYCDLTLSGLYNVLVGACQCT